MTSTNDWTEQFARWARPASETEETKASRAADMIRDAVRSHDALKQLAIDVYATGSYRNNTNVRAESDIDVAVVYRGAFFYDLPDGVGPEAMGWSSATYGFSQFRADLEAALRDKFGAAVDVGDKTFGVPENTYRLEADATPFFEYRKHEASAGGLLALACATGVKSVSRKGTAFVNWHVDHYERGVAKNTATKRRFKRVARILKNVKRAMEASGDEGTILATKRVPSFLLECLAYNAPNDYFNRDEGYVRDVEAVLAFASVMLANGEAAKSFVEVSERKALFAPGQPWTREQAAVFVSGAWRYLGF